MASYRDFPAFAVFDGWLSNFDTRAEFKAPLSRPWMAKELLYSAAIFVYTYNYTNFTVVGAGHGVFEGSLGQKMGRHRPHLAFEEQGGADMSGKRFLRMCNACRARLPYSTKNLVTRIVIGETLCEGHVVRTGLFCN